MMMMMKMVMMMMMRMMMMMSVGSRCCVSVVLVVVCAGVSQCELVHGEQVAFVRVSVQQEPSSVFQGRVLQGQQQQQQQQQQRCEEEHELRGDLRLIKDEPEGVRSSDHRRAGDEGQRSKPWIGVVPAQVEGHVPNTSQESFASSVVNKMKRALVLGASVLIILVLNQNTLREMKRALVLGASALIILVLNQNTLREMKRALVLGASALIILVLNQNTLREMKRALVLGASALIILVLNQNTLREMKRALVLGASVLIILVLNQNTLRELDVSQLLSKPIIIIHNSENVTKLFSALLRGLHATARITYQTFLQNNLGATLTLWSSCGRSRWGRYGEWQGVVCTGETNSPEQKYLQQLWNTVVLITLILSTGVLLHARWQHHDHQLTEQLQLHLEQELLNKLSVLKTRKYRQRKHTEPPDNCAVCLEQYTTNQCLRVLPCLHEFHRDCVDPWLLLQQTCPLCKRCVLGSFC